MCSRFYWKVVLELQNLLLKLELYNMILRFAFFVILRILPIFCDCRRTHRIVSGALFVNFAESLKSATYWQ